MSKKEKRSSSIQKIVFFLILLLVFVPNAGLLAQQPDTNKPGPDAGLLTQQQEVNENENFFDASIEQLMEVKVISASRQPTPSQYLSAPVTVITAEDIHYSGATTIPEILQFSPGLDVRRLDRQRYADGVRGLFGVFSDRTLVLIDGGPRRTPFMERRTGKICRC